MSRACTSAPTSRRCARPPARTAGAVRTGVVWGETFNKFDPTSPFGGYKESGFGREGGLHGLLPYLELT